MSALDSRLPERGGLAPHGRPAARRAPQQLYRPPGQRERYRPPSRQQEEPPAERRPPRQLYVPPRGRRAGFNRASSPGFSTCSEIVTSWRAEPEVLRARPPPGPRRRISQQTRQHVQSIAEDKWRQEDGDCASVGTSRPQSRQDSERGVALNLQRQRCDLSGSRQSLDGSTPEASPAKRPGRRRRRGRRARSRSEDRTAAEQPPSFQLLTFPLPPTATAPHPPHVPWRSNSLASLSRAVSADPELPRHGTPPPAAAPPPPAARPASATPPQRTQQAPSQRLPRPQGVYQPPAARRLGHTVGTSPAGCTAEGHGPAPARHGHGQGRPGGESGRARPHRTSRSGESGPEESEPRLRDGWGGENRARSLRGEGGARSETWWSEPRPSCRQGKGRWFDEGVWCSAGDPVDSLHSCGLRRPRLRQVSSGSSSEPCSPQKPSGDGSYIGQLSHSGASHSVRSDSNSSDALLPHDMPGRTLASPLRGEHKRVSDNPGQGEERSPGCSTELVLDGQRAALTQKTTADPDRRVVGEAALRPLSIESRSSLSTPPHSNSGRVSPRPNGATGGRWCVNVSRDSGADDEASPLSCFEEASTGEEVTPLDSDGDASLWFGPYTDDQKVSMGMKVESQHRVWPVARCPEREGSQCKASGGATTDISIYCDSRTPGADGCEHVEFQSAVTESRSGSEHVNGVVAEACGAEVTNSAAVREGGAAPPESSAPTNAVLVPTTDSHPCGGHLNPPLSVDSDRTRESASPASSTTQASSAPSQLSAAGSSSQPDATGCPADTASAETPCQSPSTSASLDGEAEDGTPFSWADEVDEWERQYTDEGDRQAQVSPAAVSETPRKPIIDYLSWRPESPQSDGAWPDDASLPAHVIEVYDFPSSFTTQDLGVIYQEFSGSGFNVKWVDDTHALAVFSSPSCAHEALQKRHPLVRGRPLARASPQARQKAARCVAALQPYRARPETCALRARRMVATALGLRAQVSPEKRDQERRQLQQAKDKKRLAAKQKEDAWEGKF